MKTNQSERDEAEGDGLNESRVQWAASALRTFQRATKVDLEDAVSDLLADLMHWCDCHDQDFEDKLRIGRMHYRAEKGK